MKYHIITFGCQMNKSDSERIAAVLGNIGYKKASKIDEADLVVVNMCSVRQSAVDRVYGKIKNFTKLKTRNLKVKTLLTGCILRRDLRKFRKDFDYVLSIKILPYWKDFLIRKKGFYYPNLRNISFHKELDANYFKIKPKYSKGFSAFIPISTGCNNFCAYCVVPFTRGPEICRDHKEILREAKEVIQKGAKEIWLLSQNVNSYNSEQRAVNSKQRITFPKLLKMVNAIPGNFWIRFTSSHPMGFSEKLIETITECEKVTEYINLPVQSGNDEVLKKMKRSYTVKHYKDLVKKIRKLIPNVCLSTDVIVGSPGETKKQFESTVKLFKEIKFDMAYIAQYSPRPQTAAFKLKDNVPKKEKERRWKLLSEVLKETALENNKGFVGKIVEVLVETWKNGFLIGKTRTYKTVKLKGEKGLIGSFVRVKIVKVGPFGLRGKLI